MAAQESEGISLIGLFPGRPSRKIGGFFFSLKVCRSPFGGKITKLKIVFVIRAVSA
jgi:hypothetical protein